MGYFGHDEALHGVVFFDTSAVKNGFGMVSPPLFFGETGGEKKGGAGMAQMPRAHDRLAAEDWGKRLFLLRDGASGRTRARFWRWWKLLGLPRITPMWRWEWVIVGKRSTVLSFHVANA